MCTHTDTHHASHTHTSVCYTQILTPAYTGTHARAHAHRHTRVYTSRLTHSSHLCTESHHTHCRYRHMCTQAETDTQTCRWTHDHSHARTEAHKPVPSQTRTHTFAHTRKLTSQNCPHVQCVSSIQGFEGLTGWTRWGRGTRAVSQAPRLRGYGRDVEVAGPGVGGWRGRDWVVESPRGQAPASLAERRRERRFALGAGREGWEVPRAVAADTGRHGHPCPPGAPEVFQLPPSAAPLLSSGLRGMSPWEWPQAELGGSWASTPLIHPWGLRITRGACSSVGHGRCHRVFC